MVGTMAASIVAAALDGYALALLIPFLNSLFGRPSVIPVQTGWVSGFLEQTVGALMEPGNPMGSLRNVILVILAVTIVKNVFIWAGGMLGVQLQEYVVRDLRDAIYTHLQRLPLGYFTTTRTGQILSRVLSDTDQTKQLITQLVTQALQNAALTITYVVFLAGISKQLTLIALVVAPLLMLALNPLIGRLRRGYHTLRNDHGEMMSVLQESVSGIRLVKSSGAESYEQGRFKTASNRFSGGLVKMARLSLLSQPITETLATVMAVFLLWIGARLVLVERSLDAAEFLVFLTFVLRLLQPIKQLSQIPASAQNALAASDRLFEVLDTPTETATDRGTIVVENFKSSIGFERVGFSYGEEPVLSDISFTARKGEVIALVGPSGAGKSTLVDLIPRFYETVSGRILLDGVDTREITLGSLRALTGIVSQETVIFNDTVRANIAYGRAAEYSEAQINAATRAANAHDFITQLPNGYDTSLGERGTRLSGGQRQRIAIARALLADPPILILDEATSALDTESERLVQEAIDHLLEGRTVFVIAHRLSTIVHANEILVLDRGRIVERGSHAELLDRRGAYFRLYSLQFRHQEQPGNVSGVPV